MTSLTYLTLDQTTLLAQTLANHSQPGMTFLLQGDLGAGKTTFSKAFIQQLCGPIDVPSPTFTLVQTYETRRGEVWHCDLYRLETPEESLELGLEDAFCSAICLIEWPERLGYLTPKSFMEIKITINPDNTRNFTFSSQGHIYEQLCTTLFNIFCH